MRYSTTSGMLLAALSIGDAMASPTHAHLHRAVHEKKDIDYAKLDWDNMGINWSSAWAAGQKTSTPKIAAPTPVVAAPSPAATTNPAAKPAATSSAPKAESPVESAISEVVDDVKGLWKGLVGCSNSRTSFGEFYKLPGGSDTPGALTQGDLYNGNIGRPYGSNVIKVSSTDGYDFTNTFINTQPGTITVNLWNKAGSNREPLSGSALAPKDTTLTFTLAPGAKQVVAFQDLSHVAWAEPCDVFAISGAFATTWGEANFATTGSGYDVSAIMNVEGNNYKMSISSKEVSCISDNTQNFWLKEYTPVGGSDGSCYVPGKTMHLTTKMGGKI